MVERINVTRDNFESWLDNNIPDIMPEPLHVDTTVYTYSEVSEYKFNVVKQPTFQSFAYAFISLSRGKCDNSIFNDIIKIALTIVDQEGHHLFTDLSNSNPGSPSMSDASYPAIPKSWEDFKSFIDDPNNDFSPQVKAVTERDEKTFKVYMTHLCMLLLRFMYKDNNQIMEKAGSIKRSTNLLKVAYGGANAYISISENLRKALRSTGGTHLWKQATSSIIINGYATLSIAKKTAETSYLSWAIMKSTYLLGFGVARLVINSMEITNTNLRQFMGIVLCDQTRNEIEVLSPVCNRIVTVPSNAEIKEWIFFKWSGMINENYHRDLRYCKNPYLSSLTIGIINGASTKGKFNFVSFPETRYRWTFYRWGLLLSKSSADDSISNDEK